MGKENGTELLTRIQDDGVKRRKRLKQGLQIMQLKESRLNLQRS